ncbi:MAG TPA: hypothetical protein VMF70_09130 [Gemmatimonadales bacterium]|nr:hypothetical protein [Gemmatimonadales bacterium]
MKRLFLAVAVLGLMACAKKEAAPPAETQTPAAAPAPAMADTTKPAMGADTSKMAAPAAAPAPAPAKKAEAPMKKKGM